MFSRMAKFFSETLSETSFVLVSFDSLVLLLVSLSSDHGSHVAASVTNVFAICAVLFLMRVENTRIHDSCGILTRSPYKLAP